MPLNPLFAEVGMFRDTELRRVKEVYAVSAVLFLFGFGWGVVGPFLYIHINNIVMNPFLLGLFISLWGIVRVFTDPIVGLFMDKFDIKKTILISCVAYFFVGLGYYFSHDIFTLFIIRIAHSVAGSFFWVSTYVYTYKKMSPRKREEQMMFENIAYLSPLLIAPIIGGLLLKYVDTYFLFLSVCVASIIAIAYFYKAGYQIKPSKRKFSSLVNSEIKTLKKLEKKMLSIILLILPIGIIANAYSTFLPTFLQSSGYSSVMIGVVSVISTIPMFLLYPLGGWSDRHGKNPLIIISLATMIIGLLGMNFTKSVPFQIILVFTASLGMTLISPTIDAIVGDIMGRDKKGGFIGIIQMCKDFAIIIGPLLGGVVVDAGGFISMLNFLSVIAVAMLALTLLLNKINKTGSFI